MNQLPVVIWACSYGTERHYFPQTMGTIIESHENPLPSFELKKINAVPGQMLDHRFMEEYETNFFGYRQGKPQMSIILMGGNDIQTHAYNGAARFLANIRTLIGWHDNSNCPLMLCGIPPRPKVHYQIEDLANYVDSKMKQYVGMRHCGMSRDCMFRFTKTFDFFRDQDGFCMTQNLYEKDEVHLNPVGVELLCKKLFDSIESQAKECLARLN